MNHKILIKEISLGKPDAKDEVLYSESLNEFCSKIILPPNFDIRNIIYKDKFYIIGNKGVGKTALLFYINNMLLKENASSACSMILFKTEISPTDRAQMDKIEQLRISNMNITDSELEYVHDFTRLWTLIIYKKIVEDNEGGKIFVKDTNWKSFESIINQLDNDKSDILKFASRIPQDRICFDVFQSAFIANHPRINYPSDDSNYSLSCFYDAIKFADKLFCSLQLKAHKYYICIDELEAYNSNRKIYIRDLAIIRDLIITTKRINALLTQNKKKNIKIILSVRTEMVRSITRELPGLEYNKDLEGFAERINWSGSRTDFIYHPLTSIWIRRIQDSLSKSGKNFSDLEIYEDIFPDVIGIDKTIDFVMDRTWQKPRDIIRLISCLHNIVNANACYYEPRDFAKAMPEYSRQSKDELTEELEAIYTSKETERIFLCLTAYKKYFSKSELKNRLNTMVITFHSNLDADNIIDDLYRIGVLGLVNFNSGNELWAYSGQSQLEDENWKYIVHRGLWSILELEKEAYEGISFIDIVGHPCECHVDDRHDNYLELSFIFRKRKLNGIIHARDISTKHVKLNQYIGEELIASVIGYDPIRKMWKLSKVPRKVI